MKQILIIFKKEFKDILRDRRTLLAMMVFPLLLVPSLLTVSTSLQANQKEKAMNKDLNVGVIDNGNGKAFTNALRFATGVKIVEGLEVLDMIMSVPTSKEAATKDRPLINIAMNEVKMLN